MRIHTTASACVFLCSVLFSGESNAELICIHPVPLTIKELVDKQKSGLISEEILELNTEFLILKYCAATDDGIPAVSSVALGDGCEMKWGYRLGELVYWATCSTDQNIEAKKNEGKEKPNPSGGSMQSLVECCLAYCRALKCNSPPATTACSPSFLTSILAKYPEAFPNAAAYKKNLYTGARSYNGTIVRSCM
jgi:hypothetical protein